MQIPKIVAAVLSLVVFGNSGVGEDALPSLQDVQFSTPTDKQLKRLEEYIAKLESLSVANDAFMVDCTGTRGYSQTKKQRLIIVDFSFIFAEDSEGKIRRYVCDQANVLNETPRIAQAQNGRGPGMLIVNNKHCDLMIHEKEGKQEVIFSRGGRAPPRPLPEGFTPLKMLSGSIIFNPTCVCLDSAMNFTEPRLETTFGGFRAKLVKGFGTLQGLEVGRWFYEADSRRYPNVPEGYGLSRSIAFRDGRPVIVEDRVGVDSKIDESPLYCRTEITWEKTGDEMRPKRIHARTGEKNPFQVEFDATLKWYVDDQIPAEVFDPTSVGKIGFGATEMAKN